jgi:diacylglycerol kinase (ATP)
MRIGAIVNPNAGGWRRLRDRDARRAPATAVARWLACASPTEVVVWETRRAGDGARLAKEACAAGCDTLVAVGGDGTINAVLQGIGGDDRVRLGLIPMGTANVLARILGLPRRDPIRAAQIVAVGEEQRIDLGRAGEHWFALVAGVGFDGAVTRSVNPGWKRWLGGWAYVLKAAQLSLRYPACPVMLRLDEGPPQQFDAYQILIANGGQYAGRFQLSPGVRMNDGYLDIFVCLRRRPLAWGIASDVLALARNRFATAPYVRHFRARRISLQTEGPLPMELDGDAFGEAPAVMEAVPDALRVLMPMQIF